MKITSLILFLFCSAGLLSAQGLAPNPACANQAPYCRTVLELPRTNTVNPISVMGFEDVLFGWSRVAAGVACPPDSFNTPQPPPDPNNATLCFYTGDPTLPLPPANNPINSVQNNWTYMGQFPAQDVWVCNEPGDPHNCNGGLLTPYDPLLHTYCTSQAQNDLRCYQEQPLEIVWMCNNKYIYTTGHRILQATNATTDWNFTVIGYPQIELPNNALGRPGIFAAQGPYSRLFYGNYNDAFAAADFYWPGAYIWYSDDCGNSWQMSLNTLGRHIQGINTDPAESPANTHVYATVDTEGMGTPNNFIGLWMSSDGGNTFNRVSANKIGIDFVFPSGSNNIYLESDGDSANSGPLLSWNKTVNLSSGQTQPTQVAASYPLLPSGTSNANNACPSWAGSGEGIFLTSEQNIFIASSTDGRPGRNGVWLLAPPNYDTPVLLEDLEPPISSVTASGGTATVTTCQAHGLQTGAFVQIGTNVAGFNTPGVTITVPPGSTMTFTYPCPNSSCPTQTATNGFVTQLTGWEFSRTVEVTDPSTNITYLYSFNQRIAKPKFQGQ